MAEQPDAKQTPGCDYAFEETRGKCAAEVYAAMVMTRTSPYARYLVNGDVSDYNATAAIMLRYFRQFYSIRPDVVLVLPTQEYVASVYTTIIRQMYGVQASNAGTPAQTQAAANQVCNIVRSAFASILMLTIFSQRPST
jgi:hypothetical protein